MEAQQLEITQLN